MRSRPRAGVKKYWVVLAAVLGSLVLFYISLLSVLVSSSVDERHGSFLPTDSRASVDSKISPSTNNSSSKLLLSVPFYVYETLAWTDATIHGTPVARVLAEGRFRKHSLDWYFLQASLQHPLRTHDPAQAKLFVIPTLLNLYSLRIFPGNNNVTLCAHGLCDRALMVHAGKVLNASTYYHRFPERHIAVTSHFGYQKVKLPARLRRELKNVNAIAFEDRKPNKRLQFSSYLVGTPCEQAEKVFDVALIATLKPNSTKFIDRSNICEWLQGDSNVSVPICGSGDQCPTLGQAKLGLHARGDSFGSQRLFDLLLSGTVPIFTHKQQYFWPWVDWDQLSYLIDLDEVRTRDEFLAALRNILQDVETFQRKLQAVLQHRHLFDWHTLYPFDTYMYLLQAHLYPETRVDSPWNAILLPDKV